MDLRDRHTHESIHPEGQIPENALVAGQSINILGAIYDIKEVRWEKQGSTQHYEQIGYVQKRSSRAG